MGVFSQKERCNSDFVRFSRFVCSLSEKLTNIFKEYFIFKCNVITPRFVHNCDEYRPEGDAVRANFLLGDVSFG